MTPCFRGNDRNPAEQLDQHARRVHVNAPPPHLKHPGALVSLQGLVHPNETEVLYFILDEMISGAESVVLDGVGTVPPGGCRGVQLHLI